MNNISSLMLKLTKHLSAFAFILVSIGTLTYIIAFFQSFEGEQTKAYTLKDGELIEMLEIRSSRDPITSYLLDLPRNGLQPYINVSFGGGAFLLKTESQTFSHYFNKDWLLPSNLRWLVILQIFHFLLIPLALYLLNRLCNAIDKKEEWFVKRTQDYFLFLSITLLTYPILGYLFGWIIKSSIVRGTEIDPELMLNPEFRFTLFLAGFFTLLISFAFEKAVSLNEEQKLTV